MYRTVSANMLLTQFPAWFVCPGGCRLQKQEDNGTDCARKEGEVHPTLQERLSLLIRTFENQVTKVQEDSMLFSDDVFTIEPVVSNS